MVLRTRYAELLTPGPNFTITWGTPQPKRCALYFKLVPDTDQFSFKRFEIDPQGIYVLKSTEDSYLLVDKETGRSVWLADDIRDMSWDLANRSVKIREVEIDGIGIFENDSMVEVYFGHPQYLNS